MLNKAFCLLFFSVFLIASVIVHANSEQTLLGLLSEGPIAQIQRNEKGEIKHAMGLAVIEASPNLTYETFTDIKNYKSFMPQIEETEIIEETKAHWDVEYEIEVPGPNVDYIMRHVFHPQEWRMESHWIDGEIEGAWSRYLIKPIEGESNRCLLYYWAMAELPGIIQSLEDDNKALTIGVNASTVMGVVTAVKREAEKRLMQSKTAIREGKKEANQ